jgi:hypothetical protein
MNREGNAQVCATSGFRRGVNDVRSSETLRCLKSQNTADLRRPPRLTTCKTDQSTEHELHTVKAQTLYTQTTRP